MLHPNLWSIPQLCLYSIIWWPSQGPVLVTLSTYWCMNRGIWIGCKQTWIIMPQHKIYQAYMIHWHRWYNLVTLCTWRPQFTGFHWFLSRFTGRELIQVSWNCQGGWVQQFWLIYFLDHPDRVFLGLTLCKYQNDSRK